MARSAKGPTYERKFCRMLSHAFTGKEDPCIFWRSAGSGSSATAMAKRGKASHMDGDIVAIDAKGAWLTAAMCIDIKSYANFNIDSFFRMQEPDELRRMKNFLYTLEKYGIKKAIKLEKSTPAYWWIKLCYEAQRNKKEPMLVIKRSGYAEWLIVTNRGVMHDEVRNIGIYPDAYIIVDPNLCNGELEIAIHRFSNFKKANLKELKKVITHEY